VDGKIPKTKIYTRKGDEGTTSDYHQERRIMKSAPIFNVIGTLDELQAYIGLAKEYILPVDKDSAHTIYHFLENIQKSLMEVGFFLSTFQGTKASFDLKLEEPILDMEKSIDELEDESCKGLHLVIPSGGQASTHLYVARTICRRFERILLKYLLDTQGPMYLKIEGVPFTLQYVNRLGDYLLVIAKYLAGGSEIFYNP